MRPRSCNHWTTSSQQADRNPAFDFFKSVLRSRLLDMKYPAYGDSVRQRSSAMQNSTQANKGAGRCDISTPRAADSLCTNTGITRHSTLPLAPTAQFMINYRSYNPSHCVTTCLGFRAARIAPSLTHFNPHTVKGKLNKFELFRIWPMSPESPPKKIASARQ